MWRRGLACQVRISLHEWPVAHVWSSLYGWDAAYLGRSWHDWHIAGRHLPQASGCQWSNHFRPNGLILVALAVEIMPCLWIERFLTRPVCIHGHIAIALTGWRVFN
jgi:hypothetical protein